MTTDSSPPGQGGPAAALADRLFHDMIGALELFTVYLGERLGLYRALASHGPATSAELAGRTGTTERYVREWLEHHAAAAARGRRYGRHTRPRKHPGSYQVERPRPASIRAKGPTP
jgi:hypothetical protein